VLADPALETSDCAGTRLAMAQVRPRGAGIRELATEIRHAQHTGGDEQPLLRMLSRISKNDVLAFPVWLRAMARMCSLSRANTHSMVSEAAESGCEVGDIVVR